ncbi:MAG: hypothetical protein KME07_13170 [Pegethrix bostrychoides GSE-TBD4-15B]|uniref:Uncharacterized protein n=1 Tax=Pegethrix bostrychoides GSE-TBD4-15B TaxID=2839662 RepID=A0A951PBB9_9CYAN|nr:hypothetical protein [Pegethrix bostrychoides GSE-TBD4-15B]
MDYANPPYFLLFAGLLIALTSGAAFEATLKGSVNDWARNRSTRTLANMRGMSLLLPFLGICLGTWLFLASGISIFGFPGAIAFGIAFLLTLLTGLLVWTQLGQILIQLEQGGSKALDLDSF